MNVETFKMIGGDEVIARVVDDGEEYITLKSPLLVAMAQQGFGLMPYVLTLEGDQLMVAKASIAARGPTTEPVAKEYIKRTSGLLMP